MRSVFLLQMKRLRRKPFLVTSFFVLTLFFVFFLGGNDLSGKLLVQAYPGENTSEEEAAGWIERLNESDAFLFELKEEEDVRSTIMRGERNMAVEIRSDDYRMLVAVDDQNYQLTESYIRQVFTEELRLSEVEAASGEENVREQVGNKLDSPVLTLETSTVSGRAESGIAYDQSLQALFGMTLYFSVFTMLFSLSTVAQQKRDGTWSRMLISPLRRWQMYLGHFAYCFLIGTVQILLVFLIFEYVLNFGVGVHVGVLFLIASCFTFAVGCLGLLLVGIVRSPQQLQAVIPVTATAMAMLGGAFWPVEIVTNDILTVLSRGMPIYYGMEALKGTALSGESLTDIAGLLTVLLLIGVVTAAAGIRLMERRS
ncbi:ABC transporter permease [Alkalicoccus saliphilus]|uniref:ABC transporter permease n=1 Tax=Alkalicoccus saliphilus TaxID=200989 RepID=A0A2T4U1N1_9BACI|nr:ABC transporter permease [Alkalicoccus saliphilus]PTL37313.1 ABC transporter permease [Alkalicoccus saliphilus]